MGFAGLLCIHEGSRDLFQRHGPADTSNL